MTFHPQDLVGTTVASSFRVLQHRASGGVGHIYSVLRADGADDSPFALKLLRPELAKKPAMVKRFEREALAAARVRHENVLFVDGPAVTEGGYTFFAMELLEGLDLADTIEHWRHLSPPRAVRIARGAALGLGAAHATGVVHRDVKPENLFLVHAPDGREIVKLLDFGTSAVEGEMAPGVEALGTPEYAAPELRSTRGAEPSSDIYSLGVLLLELLTGDVRVPPLGREGLLSLTASKTLLAPGASAELDVLVREMLSREPRARPSSMIEVAERLGRTLEAR